MRPKPLAPKSCESECVCRVVARSKRLSSEFTGLAAGCGEMSQIRAKWARETALSSCSERWAVLGSNQWPLPCETGVGCLRINDMRVEFPIATGTWYQVMSLDIKQCHERSVPKLSQLRACESDAALAAEHF